MLSAQDSAQGPGLWSLGLSALWSAAWLARSGEDRFGDHRTVLAPAGSIMAFTGIAGSMPVDGIIIKRCCWTTAIAKNQDARRKKLDAARISASLICGSSDRRMLCSST
jgi:hypothetical protein